MTALLVATVLFMGLAATGGEQERSDRDADGRPVQLEIPATGQRVAGE